ncbi:MAG TPA: Ppx/GppA phosphatase family protein [Caulobacteraceae bacterium]|jgi:exopolyphosphatase/guanosine-5'-triphosphate,3'-diphosphate pyrophosphatase|nr:Ppx/GppA phosphatase family protein [Caulobacteraceae bacterium]
MTETQAPPPDGTQPLRSSTSPPCYAALDLGTNNCRLLIASPAGHGFRVVEAFSRIVRLGDGLSRTGRLDPAAMDRAMGALKICAEKVRRRQVLKIRAVATQACRSAENGPEFVDEVERETGLKLRIISPREEAQLSVAGCVTLLDRKADAALVVDVGGGSTELSWVDLKDDCLDPARRPPPPHRLPIRAWLSIPVGVVTLAERFPEGAPANLAWFRAMVDHVRGHIEDFPHAESLRGTFAEGRAHLVGTSGAITSLAGMHLGLRRYERGRIDGLWLSRDDCEAAADHLLTLTVAGRAAEPCIGPDRADLVLAGAAILQAVQELWPCARVRVADRGLREGLLLALMAERAGRGGRNRRRGGRAPRRGEPQPRPEAAE